ncbi:MAG TPA: DUF402 domain-containing protein [Pyrinomonadaceae bacterium]|jgi:hypothetical protein
MIEASDAHADMVTVRSCKYDGREHRRWRGQLVQREDNLLVLDARFETEVNHNLLGRILSGTVSIEYYWLNRWYNVLRFLEPDGKLRNFYCNVNIPPTFDGRVLTYVDLDMDILVAPDLSYRILDEDEFEVHSRSFNYPAQVRAGARRALEELVSLIERREFPFDR